MKHIEPWRINPPHEQPDPSKVDELAADMRERGWMGRPLLVEPRDDHGQAFQGWTGSHRLAAALRAGLKTVETEELDLDAWAVRLAGKLSPGQTIFGLSETDADRLEACEAVGDRQAAQLIRAEIRASKGTTA